MTKAGRDFARANPGRCFEVRFEELIADPSRTLARIGAFIDHDLDYARIQRNPVHALKSPNTSFREERYTPDFNPVGRWQTKISAEDLALCNTLVGPTLRELGYDSSHPPSSRNDLHARMMRACYPQFYATKHLLKTRTRLGRVLTSTKVWNEQPREGESPLQPVQTVARLVPNREMVAN
jgi:hypothetical protein